MNTCTFFGHSDTPFSIEKKLKSVLIDLIQTKNVKKFYVGNHGNFDKIVRKVLRELSEEYKSISYFVVFAYRPLKKEGYDYSDTIYPEELCTVPYKLAILKRNEWMINNSDYVVTYVRNNFGGASKFKEMAYKKELNVLDI